MSERAMSDAMTVDETQAALQRQFGIDASRARSMAVAALGAVAVSSGIETPSDDAMREAREDAHQNECRKLMRALGFEVVNFSQKKRAKVTPGIPDTKYYHRARWLTLWHEDKATWGRQSPAQREFQAMAEACDELYVLGHLQLLREWLVAHRVAVETSTDVMEPLPYRQFLRSIPL